ncbi:MAG: flagellar hook-basal body complex protein FliE [Pseudomonadota bacterium]
MALTGISPAISALHEVANPAPASPAGTPYSGPSFADRMGQTLSSVNAQQLRASDAARDFETGRTNDLVSVMVEQQISSLGFEMTKQVRNRALSAYRDIMNMPV